MKSLLKDIRKLSAEEITADFSLQNIPKYRAKQVTEWLWNKSAGSFDEMTNLSKEFRFIFRKRYYTKEGKKYLYSIWRCKLFNRKLYEYK